MKFLKARRLLNTIGDFMEGKAAYLFLTGMNTERRLNCQEEYTEEEAKDMCEAIRTQFRKEFDENLLGRMQEILRGPDD